MPELTIEARVQLAEKVMRWKRIPPDPNKQLGAQFTAPKQFFVTSWDKPAIWCNQEINGYPRGGLWAPDGKTPESLLHALGLLEAWCGLEPDRRWYRHEREVDGRHSIILFDVNRVQLGASTLPAAIVAAVCNAERTGGE